MPELETIFNQNNREGLSDVGNASDGCLHDTQSKASPVYCIMQNTDNKKLGYISVFRSIMDNPLYPHRRKFTKFEAWIDLLLRANYSDNRILEGNNFIEIKRGCLLTSELVLSKQWCWSRNEIRGFLKLLQADNMIEKNSTSKFTIITICNYDFYQNNLPTNNQQSNNEATTEHQQKYTNNKEKNNNKKNKANKVFIPPTQIEVENYFAENGYSKESAVNAFKYYDISGWVDSRGAKVRNWKQKMLSVWFKEENRITKEQAKIDREEWVRQQGKGVTYEQMERKPQ